MQGETLLHIENLKKHFPVKTGVLFKRIESNVALISDGVSSDLTGGVDTITTGMARVRSADRSVSSTANPSFFGSRMSRKMISGTSSSARRRPSSPSFAMVTW